MASNDAINEAIGIFGDTYNWAAPRRVRIKRAWKRSEGILALDDDKLLSFAAGWCDTQDKAPTQAEVIAGHIGGGKTRAQAKYPPGCLDCDGTGWRQMARHWRTPNGERRARFTATCECELGKFYTRGEVKCWKDVLEIWDNQDTIETWVTDERMPDLPDEALHTPEQIQALEARRQAYREDHPHQHSVRVKRDRDIRSRGQEVLDF